MRSYRAISSLASGRRWIWVWAVTLGFATTTLGPILGLSRYALFAQQGSGLPWTSTFEVNNFSEWNDYASANNLTVVGTGCVSGRCARTDIIPGTVGINYAGKWFGDWHTLRGTKVESLYLRFYSKFSAGYIWPNRSQKMAILNLTDGLSSERRYQVYVFVNPSGIYGVDYSDIANWVFRGVTQNVGTAVGPRPDQWDKIKLYVRLNTPGQADGVIRMWVNDVLKLDHSNVPIRANTSFGMNHLLLSNSATQQTLSNGYQWWDSWILSHTDPDGGTSGEIPAPPTNLRIVQ